MYPPLSPELHAWFHDHAWTVLHITRVAGGYAARGITRIEAQAADGHRASFVYKQLARDRINERHTYAALSSVIESYGPRLYASIEEADGYSLLLEDAGVPLKDVLRERSPAGQLALIGQSISWLTSLHIQFEAMSQRWLEAGTLDRYPVSSSVAWAQEALAQLAWARDDGIDGCTPEVVRDVAGCAEKVYTHLEAWMTGRATLTHGDPHLGNLLLNSGRLTLIDWEYPSVAIPQRDLAIFLQDVLDESAHEMAWTRFTELLQDAGWPVAEEAFRIGWLACFFDNTLMMLGWEILQCRRGTLPRSELALILGHKLRWLQATFSELHKRALA
ncbi:phosphotransferase [Alicyclobacillus cycloheptanicus]|uniref:Aminoglycoside phosphotransferase domain-containing protein n=1 Tax=Alicyclobacillus cycloheptanicus TaxID=1457 RepID=A0ABT9XI85_9BACL|nr:phosphotransferase [Alicyclobacillus cycloheptanicus]MDQ0190029.1 hypothetical protein [Alicyclobacillus cycloheptanicus]WDM00069.1 phosphotransferase [Alicyclobacillus cycloheptanicus]